MLQSIHNNMKSICESFAFNQALIHHYRFSAETFESQLPNTKLFNISPISQLLLENGKHFSALNIQ